MDDCDAFPSCLLHHLHLLRYFSSRRRASVGGQHNEYGQAKLPPNIRRVEQVQKELQQTPYRLDQQRRGIVLRALRETCLDRRWRLLAAHVRNNHVHVVVRAAVRPELILGVLKSRASQRLSEAGIDKPGRRRWTRHGSTLYLWKEGHVDSAIHYVMEGQGRVLAVHDGRRDQRKL